MALYAILKAIYILSNAKSIRRNGYIKNNVCMVKVKLSEDIFHDYTKIDCLIEQNILKK